MTSNKNHRSDAAELTIHPRCPRMDRRTDRRAVYTGTIPTFVKLMYKV